MEKIKVPHPPERELYIYLQEALTKGFLFFIITVLFTINIKADEVFGPINYHISSPVRGLKNELFKIYPQQIEKGSVFFETSYSWINIWNYKKDFFLIDMEVLSVDYFISHAISQKELVSVNIPVYYISGGHLDSAIEKFHNSLGLTNANREQFSRNKVNYEIKDTKGNIFSIPSEKLEGYDMGNLNLIYQKSMCDNSNLTKAFGINFKIPVSPMNEVFETIEKKKTDLTLSYSWTLKKKKENHHLQIANTIFGKNSLGDIKIERTNATVFYAYEKKVRKNFHVLYQFQIDEKISKYVPEFDKPTHIMNFGFKYKEKNRVYTFSIIENMIVHDNSPDIGFFFGVKHKLK